MKTNLPHAKWANENAWSVRHIDQETEHFLLRVKDLIEDSVKLGEMYCSLEVPYNLASRVKIRLEENKFLVRTISANSKGHIIPDVIFIIDRKDV